MSSDCTGNYQQEKCPLEVLLTAAIARRSLTLPLLQRLALSSGGSSPAATPALGNVVLLPPANEAAMHTAQQTRGLPELAQHAPRDLCYY